MDGTQGESLVTSFVLLALFHFPGRLLIQPFAVVITLIPIHSQPNLPSTRSFVLSKASPIISLGRSSKREGRNREPACDNGWFDSRVMSRDHAELSISQKNKVDYYSTMRFARATVLILHPGCLHSGLWLNPWHLAQQPQTDSR